MIIARRSIGLLAAIALAATTLLFVWARSAQATTPVWEPDPNSASPYGNVILYDSSGNVLTGGSDLTHLADYAKATTGPDANSTKANLLFARPDHTQANTTLWTASAASASTTFPNASAPAPLDTETNPVVTLGPTDADLQSFYGGISPDTTAGYENIFQVRLKDIGTGGAGSGSHYWSSDIEITITSAPGDPITGTWEMIYPVLQPPAWQPVLYGSHKIGVTDKCLADFDNTDSIAYKWYHDATEITGATASSYKIAEGYWGEQISCSVSAANNGGTTEATSDQFTIGTGPALVPTSKPYLYHSTNRTTATHGTYEYVNHGTWSPAATSYTYQWYVGTSKISGATSSKYVPPSSYIGKYLYCVVTAKRLHWTNGVYKTAGVKVV